MQVRPDDIDMNRHVHNSRYLDYVLAARYDQLARCYGMPMEEYLEHGLSWVVSSVTIDYRRPLGLGDRFIVRTWIEQVHAKGVRVSFEILRAATSTAVAKLAAAGTFDYVLIEIATGRATPIPAWVLERYTV